MSSIKKPPLKLLVANAVLIILIPYRTIVSVAYFTYEFLFNIY